MKTLRKLNPYKRLEVDHLISIRLFGYSFYKACEDMVIVKLWPIVYKQVGYMWCVQLFGLTILTCMPYENTSQT